MGRVAADLLNSIEPGQNQLGNVVGTECQIHREFSFSFEDGAFSKELLLSLSKVIEECNELLHKKLMRFDPESKEGCQTLISELDD